MNDVQAKSERRSHKAATTLRHQDLHDRLIEAAEAAIMRSGLASVRARSLAEAVGCSVGAIYGVFPDLDALILVVNGRTLDAIDAVMRGVTSDGPAAEHLVLLAETYLDYADTNRQRWTALFQHRLPKGRAVTPEYAAKQAAAFGHIERPLGALLPGMAAAQQALLARTMFSAVHGMVELGLDEKVAAMPPAVLRDEIRLVVRALAAGLRALMPS